MGEGREALKISGSVGLAVACALTARLEFPGELLLAAFALLTAGLLAGHVYRRYRTDHA